MNMKKSSATYRPFCLGLKVIKRFVYFVVTTHHIVQWPIHIINVLTSMQHTNKNKIVVFSMPSYYSDVIMTTISSQITSLRTVYSSIYSDADQRKHQSSASLAFVRGIHRWPVYSPHKRPVTRKMFPFDDVMMEWFQWFTTPLSFQVGLAWIQLWQYFWYIRWKVEASCQVSHSVLKPFTVAKFSGET